MFYNSVILIAAVLFGEVGTASSGSTTVSEGKCHAIDDSDNVYNRKYHSDTSCDRFAHNTFRHRLERSFTHQRLLPTGAVKVPNAKTVVCPAIETVQSLTSQNEEGSSVPGFGTIWLVENIASTPIVVAWVDPDNGGAEYSAKNRKIIPPNRDQQTIIQPGQFNFFHSVEGDVFHVRSILEDGLQMGEILLQYRQGLIPIRNRYGPPDLLCDPHELDIEPIIDEARDPNYARGPPVELPFCNIMDVGFRNEVGCPLNAYFSWVDYSGPTCENFQFHLGLNPVPNDYVWDWASQTKWEGTYVGHHFVFRLAKDTSVVVDKVDIQPTYVADCPNHKAKEKVQSSMEINPIGILQHVPTNSSTNATRASAMQQNIPCLNFNETTLAPHNYFVTLLATH